MLSQNASLHNVHHWVLFLSLGTSQNKLNPSSRWLVISSINEPECLLIPWPAQHSCGLPLPGSQLWVSCEGHFGTCLKNWRSCSCYFHSASMYNNSSTWRLSYGLLTRLAPLVFSCLYGCFPPFIPHPSSVFFFSVASPWHSSTDLHISKEARRDVVCADSSFLAAEVPFGPYK